jgi:hypothetical protein
MTGRKSGVTRRRAITLASAAATAAMLPPMIGTATKVAVAVNQPLAPTDFGELDWGYRYIAARLDRAREVWQQVELAYRVHVETAQALLSSEDMDAIMDHRIGHDVVAFDMSVRAIMRLSWLAKQWTPANDAERTIHAQSLQLKEEATASGSFRALSNLCRHISDLQARGFRANDHRYKREVQRNRQHEFSGRVERTINAAYRHPRPQA